MPLEYLPDNRIGVPDARFGDVKALTTSQESLVKYRISGISMSLSSFGPRPPRPAANSRVATVFPVYSSSMTNLSKTDVLIKPQSVIVRRPHLKFNFIHANLLQLFQHREHKRGS